ncbi:MAG TPA: RES family NAD+ phosphorylase [Longimicrobiales bacterium]|nr:RES family NAD+ phosphorylase [Longimicrobiales bacterium]
MVSAWRMVRSHHAASAFDGEGARRFGGRWNSPGTAVVYASESRALAMLEVLAGLGAVGALAPYVLVGVRFPESLVSQLDPEKLPDSWRAYPPPAAVQRIGDDWVRGGTSPVLRVPSVVVPGESNYVLNPRHPEFGKLKIGQPEAVGIDPRFGR